jgi:hypothetical protein
MADAGTGLFTAFAGRGPFAGGVGLGVDRPHAGGGAGRDGPGLRLELGEAAVLFIDAACGAEQCERDGLGSELVEPLGGVFIADAALQGRQQFVERVGMRRRVAHAQHLRAGALPAQGLF